MPEATPPLRRSVAMIRVLDPDQASKDTPGLETSPQQWVPMSISELELAHGHAMAAYGHISNNPCRFLAYDYFLPCYT